jgi:aminomethyltransferase
MRRTPLDALHTAAGARWMAADGWALPADFGAPDAEYAALRDGAALLDLSLRGKLRITGPDRATFLHNMVTNDVLALRAGHGCNAAKLSLQGKMEGALHLLCDADALWCDVDPGASARVLEGLRKHLIMEDAAIEDVTDAWALIALQGPHAARALVGAGAAAPAAGAALDHEPARIAGVALRLVRNDHCGGGGFDLWIEAAGAPMVWQALVHAGARPVGLAALDVRRIEAGIPWFGSEITGDQFPQEAGLEAGWISYTKGCYLGQETISRLHHLGHVNRVLRGLHVDDGASRAPERGSELYVGDKRVGVVTSATRSPALGHTVALAYVHREFAAPGTVLEVADSGVRRGAVVAALPFA